MQRQAACFAGLLLIGAATVGAGAFGGVPAWRYVAGVRADAATRPVFRFVPLSGTKPADLREEVVYRGRGQKYAQVRYGSENSRRVVVVVDEVSRDEFDVYVDANRSRAPRPSEPSPRG